MQLQSIPYTAYEKELPQSGRHILAQTRGENIIVYQAFNPKIARFAVEHQRFGGSHYKFTRMSWIKPNFLWMMYRAGWAVKEHQQQILAIEISQEHFKEILAQAVHSTYTEHVYGNHEAWKAALASSEVRLQWDPDHNPFGDKLDRRAIQLGLRGNMLRQFATDWIVSIEDITPFVHEQKALLDVRNWDEFKVIKESVWPAEDQGIINKLGLDSWPS